MSEKRIVEVKNGDGWISVKGICDVKKGDVFRMFEDSDKTKPVYWKGKNGAEAEFIAMSDPHPWSGDREIHPCSEKRCVDAVPISGCHNG